MEGGSGQRSDPTGDGRKNARNGSMEEEGEGRLMDGEERAGLLLHAITFVIVTESSRLRGHCHKLIQYREKRISCFSSLTGFVLPHSKLIQPTIMR